MLSCDRDDPVAGSCTFGGNCLDAALQRPVERLRRAAGESDAAALEAHRALDLLACDFDRGFRFVPPARRRMWIGEFLLDPRLHRSCDFRRERSCRLVVEVDHAALALAAIRRQSAVKRSMSASAVFGPKLMRR